MSDLVRPTITTSSLVELLLPPDTVTELSFVADIDDLTIRELLSDLRDALLGEKGRRVVLYLSSDGGELSSAFMAYDRIRALCKKQQAELNIVATGACLSAGLVLLQAGTKRLSMPHTLFMTHSPQQHASDSPSISPTDLASRLSLHDVTLDLLISIFSHHSQLSPSLWRKTLTTPGEKFFDASKALALGLVDAILE